MEASPRPDTVGLLAGLRLPEVQPRPPPTNWGGREIGNVPFPHPMAEWTGRGSWTRPFLSELPGSACVASLALLGGGGPARTRIRKKETEEIQQLSSMIIIPPATCLLLLCCFVALSFILEQSISHPFSVRMYSGWLGPGLQKVSSCLSIVCLCCMLLVVGCSS